MLIKDCPKFKDQYNALKKKRGEKAAVADEEDMLKRPRGKTSSKADENRDASSIQPCKKFGEYDEPKESAGAKGEQREEGANEDIPTSSNEEA